MQNHATCCNHTVAMDATADSSTSRPANYSPGLSSRNRFVFSGRINRAVRERRSLLRWTGEVAYTAPDLLMTKRKADVPMLDIDFDEDLSLSRAF